MPVRTVGKLEYAPPFPLSRPRAAPTSSARFFLDSDVSPLFPYINSDVEGALYFEKPDSIRFVLDDVQCTLYSQEGLAAPFHSLREARAFAEGIVDYLNELEARRASIAPDHHRHKPLSALSVFRALPRTNCGLCGKPTCMAFAVAISQGQALPSECPEMPKPIVRHAVYPIFDAAGELIETVELETPSASPRADGAGPDTPATAEEAAARIAEANATLPEPLTARELEVLGLVATGLSNGKIAEKIHVSVNTVKTHLRNIRGKLAADNRVHAVAIARELGLLFRGGDERHRG